MKNVSGLGLGLYITQELIKAHDGSIQTNKSGSAMNYLSSVTEISSTLFTSSNFTNDFTKIKRSEDPSKFSVFFSLLSLLSISTLFYEKNARAGYGTLATCPRPAVGSVVSDPLSLFSTEGVLSASLTYSTSFDEDGNELFCYLMSGGQQSPVFRVNPGDHLQISLQNI